MPLPFDMLAVMLFLGYYTETVTDNPPAPGYSLAVVLAAAAAVFLAATVLNRLALRRYSRPGLSAAGRRGVVGHAEGILRALLVVAYMSMLEESALPWSLAKAWNLPTHPEAFAVQVIGLLPYVILFFAAWIPMFPLHRTVTPGTWTRTGFVLHKARYNLYILLAWIPFAFLADWLGEFIVVLPLIFLVAAWAFPVLLARAWGCRPLPEGDTLDRVRRMEEKAGVRFSRVYLWEPGGGNTQNAAAVGVLPPFRYLFLTPAIIRGMDGPELDAVILHELGHIRKKHLVFYLVTSLAGINAAVLAGFLLPVTSAERFIVTAALVLFYFRFVFGWLSRGMERQADLFALEKTGSARGLANALEKLGISAGNIRLASSWHHLGIAERVDFLRRAERNPDLAAAHNAGISHLMWSGYMLSFLMIAFMGWLAHVEYTRPPAPAPGLERGERETRGHWRRVHELMPANAAVQLELAHSLARSPDRREEAADLARRAFHEGRTDEVRAAAAQLLGDLVARE